MTMLMKGDMMKQRLLVLLMFLLCFAMLFGAVSCSNDSQKDQLGEVLTEKLDPAGYTSASYSAYLDAYEKAQAVYDNDKASALEIDRAIEELQKAKDALVRTADFSQLALAIEDSNNVDPTLYTEQSYQLFLAALNGAKEVYQKDTSKQSEINSAITSLKNAKAGLVKIPSTSSLQQLLQSHIESATYTSTSYAIYEEAYTNALNLVSSGSATQSELLLAENLLKQAIAALVQRGDTTPLQGILLQLENGYLQEDGKGRLPEDRYTAESYAAFIAFFDEAKKYVSTGDASVGEVEKMISDLNDSAAALVDLTELLDRIDLLTDYSSQSHFYTEESYDVLLSAVSAGISVVKTPNSTKDRIEKAIKDIDNAIAALVRRGIVADHDKNKLLLDKVIVVGNSATLLSTYFADYTVFFAEVESENVNFAYSFVGEDGVEFSFEQVKILMRDGYLKLSYEGGYPLDEDSLSIVEFAGIGFDMTEFDVSSEAKLGAPTEYSTRTEVILGNENTIAILSYENEDDGVKVIFEYNTIGNYISSIELVRIG